MGTRAQQLNVIFMRDGDAHGAEELLREVIGKLMDGCTSTEQRIVFLMIRARGSEVAMKLAAGKLESPFSLMMEAISEQQLEYVAELAFAYGLAEDSYKGLHEYEKQVCREYGKLLTAIKEESQSQSQE